MKCLICLPLHVWDRELDSRLLWGYILAKLGFDVFIGHEYSLSALYNLNIPIFHIGAGRPVHNNPRSSNWYPNILSSGGYVGLVYEEGINDLSHGPLHHFPGITFDACVNISKIYGWSVAERKLAQQASPDQLSADLIEQKYMLSCHSRFELLGRDLGFNYYNKATSSISNIFGRFVLISDNFGIEAFGMDKPLSYKSDWSQFSNKANLKQLLSDRDQTLADAAKTRDLFAKLIFEIASANPSINFLLRPHPVSNPSYWNLKFNALRNVTVLYQGSCEPWLLACTCLIHSGCTMGIQAIVANTPEIDISRLILDERNALSSQISLNKPNSVSEFTSILKNVVDSKKQNNCRQVTKTLNTPADLFSFLTHNIENSSLSYFNDCVSDEYKIPDISMAQKVVENCLAFNNQLSTYITNDIAYKALDMMPRIKPNYNKSRFWSVTEINDRLLTYNKLFSSFTKTKLKLIKSKSPNVFFLTSR